MMMMMMMMMMVIMLKTAMSVKTGDDAVVQVGAIIVRVPSNQKWKDPKAGAWNTTSIVMCIH